MQCLRPAQAMLPTDLGELAVGIRRRMPKTNSCRLVLVLPAEGQVLRQLYWRIRCAAVRLWSAVDPGRSRNCQLASCTPSACIAGPARRVAVEALRTGSLESLLAGLFRTSTRVASRDVHGRNSVGEVVDGLVGLAIVYPTASSLSRFPPPLRDQMGAL